MSLNYQPFAQSEPIDELRRDLDMNVADRERTASVLLGAGLLGFAVTRESNVKWILALLGGALVHRGWTGRCNLYAAMEVDRRHGSSGVPGNRGTKVEDSVEIQCPPEILFNFWRNLEQLPRVMRHVEAVTRTGPNRSHWKVNGPAGTSLEWDAEIINEEQGRMIAWQSTPGATVRNAGSVRFDPAPQGGTRVRVVFEVDPPAGALGVHLSELLGRSPQEDLREDLRRFKEFAESELSGSIAPASTTATNPGPVQSGTMG